MSFVPSDSFQWGYKMYSDNQIKHSSELEVKEGYPENDIRLFCFIVNRIHWRKKDFL